ncbi:MAG: alpha/beta hydrolase family protein [Microthrixaceae bacterium]
MAGPTAGRSARAPARPREVHAVALWPGAGTTAEHPSLLALETAVAPLPAFRFDFPYRREGRKAPDRANKLIASLREDVAGLCAALGTTPEHVVLGGRSMGGRMCSMAVAGATGNTAKGSEPFEEPLDAAGLLLIAYPLHPPGKPERLRVEHLPDIAVPSLFVSGDRDPFGTPEELAGATAAIRGPVTSVTVPGKGHDLKGADERVRAAVRSWLGLEH